MRKMALALVAIFCLAALWCCSGENRTQAPAEGGKNAANSEIAGETREKQFTEEKEMGFLNLITNIKRTEKNLLDGFCDMYHPTVKKEQLPGCEGYPYSMWFFGWSVTDTNPGYPGCDAIFLARGKDPYTWEVWAGEDAWDGEMDIKKWVPIVTADEGAWYDNWHNGDPSVVKKDGVYYMMYSSYASGPDMKFSWESGDVDGDLCCVMGARSDDGIHWTKSGGPVLVWEPEIDAPYFGDKIVSPPDFRGLYHRPSLMFDESIGKWRMWFDYNDGRYLSVGYAEAEADADIMQKSSWTELRNGDDPMFQNFPNPDVIKIGGRYYMFSDPGVSGHGADPGLAPPLGWPDRQIVVAVSDDGYEWRLAGWMLPDSDTPANQIPCGYYEEGVLYIYYAAQIGGGKTPEQYNWRYDRIRVIEVEKEEFEKW